MKRLSYFVSVLLIITFLPSCGRTYLSAEDYTVPLNSTAAFVFRFSDGSVSKTPSEKSERIYPASTTKLLTALTALDIAGADMLISPGDEVYYPPEGSSSAYIRPGHTLTLEMLIEAMLLPSGNDAAYAAAAGCGSVLNGGNGSTDENIAAFMARMNSYAESIGCTGSNFTVPDGYAGNEHYSTLDDMLIISRAACENEIIMKYAALYTDDVVYASGHINTWTNTNSFLDPASQFYNENVIGLKTGSLSDYYTLITLYDDGADRLLIGVFGADDDNERYIDTELIISEELKASRRGD